MYPGMPRPICLRHGGPPPPRSGAPATRASGAHISWYAASDISSLWRSSAASKRACWTKTICNHEPAESQRKPSVFFSIGADYKFPNRYRLSTHRSRRQSWSLFATGGSGQGKGACDMGVFGCCCADAAPISDSDRRFLTPSSSEQGSFPRQVDSRERLTQG